MIKDSVQKTSYKNCYGFIFILSVSLISLYSLYPGEVSWSPYILQIKPEEITNITRRKPGEKTVYYWQRPPWVHHSVFNRCSHRCTFLKNEHALRDADAVIFHGPNIKNTEIPKKQPGQIWIFMAMESPEMFRKPLNRWKGLFNWAVTYRRDSDIFFTHGTIQPIESTRTQRQINETLAKTKQLAQQWKLKREEAAWMVSRCKTASQRKTYVNLLEAYFPIDIYGKCGDRVCPRSLSTECLNMVSQRYQFYLSFENAFCADYLTEKVYNVFKQTEGVIPIVRGGANYSLYLPPNSFIDASQFSTAKELAKHVLAVRETYPLKYFSYRNFYEPAQMNQMHFCELCRRLHNLKKYNRLYTNVFAWYNGPRNAPICNISSRRPPK